MGRRPGQGNPQNLIPNVKGGPRRGGRARGTGNKLTIARVEEEIRRIALFDIGRIFEYKRGGRRANAAGKAGGGYFTLKQVRQMPAEVRAAIVSIEVCTKNLTAGDGEQDTVVKIKLADKMAALELCAKHFGWISDGATVNLGEETLARLDAWKVKNLAERGGGG